MGIGCWLQFGFKLQPTPASDTNECWLGYTNKYRLPNLGGDIRKSVAGDHATGTLRETVRSRNWSCHRPISKLTNCSTNAGALVSGIYFDLLIVTMFCIIFIM